MVELMNTYVDAIVTQREWSWTVIGIVYLIIALIIRSLFLSSMNRRVKDLNRHQYHEVTSAYLKRCSVGWVFFLISFAFVVWLWSRVDLLPLSIKNACIVLGIIVSYILAILSHTQAMGIAALMALKKTAEKEISV